MFGIIIFIAAGIAYFAAGKAVAIVLAVILGLIWAGTALRARSAQNVAAEEDKYPQTRLVRRAGLPKGLRMFPGRQQQHAPTDWCDGWCDDPDGHKTSKVVINRKKDAKKDLPYNLRLKE